ncbi:diphthamide biosynthesis protein 2 [Candidozyma haemuli]|uniref:2-(3-amino-3-carboxypropyl)histidine synthase subunit 2 n=1 Tax=Candidozyma haemuli TaxID=45357 RepID=A0A2V1ARZ8_9ASCO|nr:diphthamide biosynthesis protein 2 [[Candida] haemuloni]PVH19711.1 diphthamide biosynthesis protein 2 [[Candida] haemuloni]
MPSAELVAPALSTAQDEQTFSYAKIDKTEIKRTHLHLQPGENYLDKIYEYYKLDEVAAFLSEKETNEEGQEVPKHKRVTLQFPDSLVCDAAAVAQQLQKKLGLTAVPEEIKTETEKENCNSCQTDCCKSKDSPDITTTQKLWVLADTSYSSCCVDEVAAEHVKSDLLIHFGDACLNAVSKLPCAYVFGKPYVDVDELVQEIRTRYPEDDTKVVLMADAPYTYILHEAKKRLEDYSNVVVADVESKEAPILGYQPVQGTEAQLRALNRVFHTIEDEESDVLAEYELFHVTSPETPRLLQLTTKFSSVTLFDPSTNSTSQGPYPNLMRRYRYMHMARSAGTIGILVNTLSLSNTRELINGIGKKLKEAGKKHYIFVVGKPNVAKLANFEAIDLWCVLGCDHQGIIVDQSNEYFKAIVTPYELLLALSDELSWTGKWVTDFKSILNELGEEPEEAPEKAHNDDSDDEAPVFDPVTGQYTSMSKPLRRLQHLQISQDGEPTPTDSTALVQKLSSAVALKNTVSTSAAHLQQRAWTGLGSDFKDQEADSDSDYDESGAAIEEGASGIARGYDFDRLVTRFHWLYVIAYLVLFVIDAAAIYSQAYKLPSEWVSLGSNDIALVTGGSSGLGLELVKQLLFEYKVGKVIVLDIRKPEFEFGSSQLEFHRCDVSRDHDLHYTLNGVLHSLDARHEHISVLVNNAGVRNSGSLLNLTDADIRQTFNVNTFAQITSLRKVISHHIKHYKHSQLYVVSVSSILAALAPKNGSVYAASKAAIFQVHESLTQELRSLPNIRLLLVAPGQLTTDMFKDVTPSRTYFAPLVNHIRLATDILKKANIGEMGVLCAPFYANWLPLVKVLPV